MKSNQMHVSLSNIKTMVVGKGLAVTIKDVTVSNIHQDTSYTPCATDENSDLHCSTKMNLDIVADIVLNCGGIYDIDATVAYHTYNAITQAEGKAGVMDCIKNSSFRYVFDSDSISNDMSHNICINSSDEDTIENILNMSNESFESTGEDEKGNTCLLMLDLTANNGCVFLEMALNKVNANFDDSLLAELDRLIREKALAILSKPAI